MADDEAPEVIPSAVDPDYDCVRAGSQDPSGALPSPPSESQPAEGAERLCPDGYVPRRRSRDYELDGKRVITGRPPEQNPDSPA